MRLFGVSQSVVLGWNDRGELEADRPPVPGHRVPFRYPRSRVIDFARQHALELNLEAMGFESGVTP